MIPTLIWIRKDEDERYFWKQEWRWWWVNFYFSQSLSYFFVPMRDDFSKLSEKYSLKMLFSGWKNISVTAREVKNQLRFVEILTELSISKISLQQRAEYFKQLLFIFLPRFVFHASARNSKKASPEKKGI